MATKPVGWKGQPARHALAAKGVKTAHELHLLPRKPSSISKLKRLSRNERKDLEKALELLRKELEGGAEVDSSIAQSILERLSFGGNPDLVKAYRLSKSDDWDDVNTALAIVDRVLMEQTPLPKVR